MSGLQDFKLEMAVVIQEMIDGEVSGVAFSVNPLTKSPREILITSTFGLGEGIVSGALNTDQFVVDKSSLSTLSTEVVEKTRRVVFDETAGKGTKETSVDSHLQEKASLSQAELQQISMK